MIEKFEEIKKRFIIDEAEYPPEKLEHLIKIMLNFVRVSKDGQVVIIKNVPTRKILPLILSARFVANKVEKNIKESIEREELKNYSYLDKMVFNARFADLKKEGFIEKDKEPLKAKNILLVERFLEKLGENK